MNYTHLTQDERYQIAILLKAGHDQSDIARVMNRHKSSISRELRRIRLANPHLYGLSAARAPDFPDTPAAAVGK